MEIEARIEELIADRARWLTGRGPLIRSARASLYRVLGHARTVALAEALAPQSANRSLDTAARLIARRLYVEGAAHIPAQGPALIVANHPTGIADGLVMWRIIASRRSDAFFFANADVLRVLPRLESVIAPVEWRETRRSMSRSRDTLAFARRALLDEERLGVIFPSGRLAKRRGLTLHERPWMQSAAALARKFDLPVVPVHIAARNSPVYYLFDAIHPSLRDITLFHETLNKGRQDFAVTIGEPIAASDLPADPAEATETLRRATLALGRPLSLVGRTVPHRDGRRTRLMPISGRVSGRA